MPENKLKFVRVFHISWGGWKIILLALFQDLFHLSLVWLGEERKTKKADLFARSVNHENWLRPAAVDGFSSVFRVPSFGS